MTINQGSPMTPTNLTARIEAMINESTDAHENGDNTVSALSVALLLLDVQAHLAQPPLREAPAPQPEAAPALTRKAVHAHIRDLIRERFDISPSSAGEDASDILDKLKECGYEVRPLTPPNSGKDAAK